MNSFLKNAYLPMMTISCKISLLPLCKHCFLFPNKTFTCVELYTFIYFAFAWMDIQDRKLFVLSVFKVTHKHTILLEQIHLFTSKKEWYRSNITVF